MTTTPQAALLREAAQNALITLDGIADTNPRDTADFETPAEWIAWAKSRARWAADALRAPIAQEIYAERILRKMLHESDQSQATHQCGTCGHIGIEDPVKGCPKCGFDDMRAINSRDTQEPVQAGELPPLPFPNDHNGFGRCPDRYTADQMYAYARAALSARKPLTPLTPAQMEKGRDQIFSINNPFCPCDSKTFSKVAEWVERHHGIGLEVKP